MTSNARADILGYVGQKGSGKTYLALKDSQKQRRLIRVDMNGQKAFEAGATICTTKVELAVAVKKWAGRKKHHICWRGSEIYGAKDAFEFACKIAVVSGGAAILMDEGQTLLPRSARIGEYASKVIMQGRHNKTPLYWTSLRPTGMFPEVRDQSDKIAFFNGYGGTYENFLRSYAPKQLIEKLQTSPRYSYILHDAGKKPKIILPKK